MSNSTQDKIIDATVALVNEKGYKGATTREIAERAGVNEVTLFRHFGNKKGIIEAVIEKYGFVDELVGTFKKGIIWEIEHDLKMLARAYQELIEKKRQVILISLKEAGQFPELDAMLARIPQASKKALEEYLREMIRLGKMKDLPVETISTSLLFMNFGYFIMKTRISPITEQLSLDAFIDENMTLFIQTLK